MTKIFHQLIYISITLMIVSCSHKNNITETQHGIKFEKAEYLDDVLTLAKDENKLVFIDFYTDWCEPCKLMEKDVFPDKEIAKFYNKNFISYKVDGDSEKGKNLAFIFQLSIYPTLLFLDTDGNVLLRNDGALYHTDFKSFGNQALNLEAL